MSRLSKKKSKDLTSLVVKDVKQRENRDVETRVNFDCLTIQSCNIKTVLDLLKSEETNVVIDCIYSLSVFSCKSTENVVRLYEIKAIPVFLRVTEHSNEIVRRFASKLVAVMSCLPEAVVDLEQERDSLLNFAHVLMKSTDEFLHEYASTVLSAVTFNKSVAQTIFETGILSAAWAHIKDANDPDIIKNCLQIILNISSLDDAIDCLLSLETFTLNPILVNLFNEFIEIQVCALDLLKVIVEKCHDTHLLLDASSSPCLTYLFEVLENPQYTELHIKALKVLNEILRNEEIVQYFLANSLLPRFLMLIESVFDIDYIICSLNIILAISKLEIGRQELYLNCIDNFLKTILRCKTLSLALKSCRVIDLLLEHSQLLNNFADVSVIECLLFLLNVDETSWTDDYVFVINCLSHLVWMSEPVSEMLLIPENFDLILSYLEKFKTAIPLESFEKFFAMFKVFSLCNEWKERVPKNRLLNVVLNYFDYPVDSVKEIAIDILSSFLCNETNIIWFLEANVHIKLIEYYETFNQKAKCSLMLLIYQLCKFKNIAVLFVENGLLAQLLQVKNENVIWQKTIELLHNTHLPSKFNDIGRLEVTDITEDNFYAAVSPIKNLPTLQYFLQSKITPVYTIYVANFKKYEVSVDDIKKTFNATESVCSILINYMHKEDVKDINRYVPFVRQIETVSTSFVKVRGRSGLRLSQDINRLKRKLKPITGSALKSPSPNMSTSSEKSDDHVHDSFKKPISNQSVRTDNTVWRYRALSDASNIRMRRERLDDFTKKIETLINWNREKIYEKLVPHLAFKSGKLPPDIYLENYLNYLKSIFLHHDTSHMGYDFSTLESRVQILAQYVYANTCGPADDDIYLTKEMHQHHLNKLKKKLGYNIIPIGFVRIGNFLERALLYKVLADRLGIPCALVRGQMNRTWVEVPLIKKESDTEEENKSEITTLSLYIVDLMYEPGTLLPIDSMCAQKYCNSFVPII